MKTIWTQLESGYDGTVAKGSPSEVEKALGKLNENTESYLSFNKYYDETTGERLSGGHIFGKKEILMEIKKKIETFDATSCKDKLAVALAKAQAELEGAAKNAMNPGFRSKYAKLDGVWEAWQDVGPKYGLSIVQLVEDAGERQGILLTTILMHDSGQSLSSTSFWPAVKNDPQGYGSALTYARRYSLMALTGICPVDDDDGNAATAAMKASQNKETAEDQKKRFDEAAKKYWDDKTKLTVILGEADKAGMKELAKLVHARIQEIK